MEGYVQGALRKELHIDPLVERFKTATLGKFYWKNVSLPGKISLNFAFLLIFCW